MHIHGPIATHPPSPQPQINKTHAYWRGLRFFNYFVTINEKNTGENTQRSKVNSSSIRQYTFSLEIPKQK